MSLNDQGDTPPPPYTAGELSNGRDAKAPRDIKSSGPSPDRQNRIIQVHETSKSISGTYPLFDILDLSSTSGSIDVNVLVKPTADSSTPRMMSIKSRSGSIKVAMEAFSLGTGDTDFNISISGESGSIQASLLHSLSTTLKTRSGSIQSSLSILHPEVASEIHTTAQSASTNVRVDSSASMPLLKAYHVSEGSGAIQLTYPHSWAGRVTANSYGSGSVQLHGPGLQVYKAGPKQWVGERGGSGSRVSIIEQGSGSIQFLAA